MLTGTLTMMATGMAIPINLYFFGDLMTKLVVFDMSDRATETGMMKVSINSNITSSNLSECALKKINQ